MSTEETLNRRRLLVSAALTGAGIGLSLAPFSALQEWSKPRWRHASLRWRGQGAGRLRWRWERQESGWRLWLQQRLCFH
ncbi:MAG: hypothetical protein VYD19_09490, partial [Myxococcota bacterium]|nr:hypothetical protein [Myxococcota bacterium]